MNIKEDYYIYKFKQLNELIEEQKITKDNDNQNNIFDIALRHEYTAIVNVTRNGDIKSISQHTRHQCLNQHQED
jgi:hypothetical protein